MFKTISMPASYDMLVSHSPPVFSHSPPNGCLSDYSTPRYYDPLRVSYRPQFMSIQQQKQKQQLLSLQIPTATVQQQSPKRSCLVIRQDDNNSESIPNTPDSPNGTNIEHIHTSLTNKIKKKVVFADDQGLQLVEVRIMSEPSNVPPLWSLKFLAHITQGLVSPVPPEQWTIDFRQPASDYLDFR